MAGEERTKDVLQGLFLLMRTVATHGPAHPSAEKASQALAGVLPLARPPFELQFVGQAIFRDRELVALDHEEFRRGRELADALAAMSVQEVAFDAALPAPGLLALGDVLAQAATGRRTEAASVEIPGVRLRAIPGAAWGQEAEDVDPDVFCATFLALAVARTEELVEARAQPWNWGRGMSVVRRLEATAGATSAAMARALEIAPGEWSPARRAVSACFRFLAIAKKLEVSNQTVRAGGHAVLALTVLGLEHAGGRPTTDAAGLACERLTTGQGMKRSNLAPHRLRVCALLWSLARQQTSPATWTGVAGLADLLYELERRRVEPGVDYALSFADLVAQAVEEMGRRFEERCVRALVHAAGEIPPGAHVRLADGSVGIVLEESETADPLRPRVLVGARVVVPDAPVALVSPAQLHAARA